MRLVVPLVLLFLFLSSYALSAEEELSIDPNLNADLADSLEDVGDVARAANGVEVAAGIPVGTLGPILVHSEEVASRAEPHVAKPGVRFGLTSEHMNPHGAVAYTMYVFRHPRTQRRTFAVLLYSLAPGLEADLMGDVHVPTSPSERAEQILEALHRKLEHSKEDLKREFGYHVFPL